MLARAGIVNRERKAKLHYMEYVLLFLVNGLTLGFGGGHAN